MKKQPSALYQTYMRERHRVQSLVSRYAKKYEEVNISIPSIPKRITQASIRRLQRITPEKVSKKTYTADPNTGERITLTKLNKAQKKQQNKNQSKTNISNPKKPPIKQPEKTQPQKQTPKKPRTKKPTKTQKQYEKLSAPSFTDIVFQNFYNTIALYPQQTQEIVREWLKALLAQTGNDKDLIAEMLQQSSDQGLIATYQEAYNANLIYENLSKMTQLMDISAGEKNMIFKELEWENDFYEEEYF